MQLHPTTNIKKSFKILQTTNPLRVVVVAMTRWKIPLHSSQSKVAAPYKQKDYQQMQRPMHKELQANSNVCW
jgi:hypothetical protein